MKELVLIGVLLALVLASGMGLAYSKHQSRKLYGQIEGLRQERLQLEMDWRRLQLRQSDLAALIKIDVKARGQLGMHVPPATDVIYLEP